MIAAIDCLTPMFTNICNPNSGEDPRFGSLTCNRTGQRQIYKIFYNKILVRNSSKCYRNRSDPAPKCASFGRGRRQDVPGCLGDGRSGKLPTIAGLATVGVMVAVWPLAAQPGDWTGAFSGDGGAAAPDAWFSFDAGISAGLLSGYAFAQFVTQAPDITAANTSVAWAALLAVASLCFWVVIRLVLNPCGFFIIRTIRLPICLRGFACPGQVRMSSFLMRGTDMLLFRRLAPSYWMRTIWTTNRRVTTEYVTEDLPASIGAISCPLRSY